jgi:hypothetical protein
MSPLQTVAVYCESHTEHTNTMCGQNTEFQHVKAGGTFRNHNGLILAPQNFTLCVLAGFK